MPLEQLSLWGPGLPAAGAAPAREPADAAERARSLDPSSSFIVQAPAGSGKTEILIQRYLTLLASVAEPEAVVAITFTIKAAGEMRERVLEALETAAGPEPAAGHERITWALGRAVLQQEERRGWGLRTNSSRLRIQTIDALCMAITRQMPWLARMGAMPDVTEDAKHLYDRAAENTLRELAGDGPTANAVVTLLRHVDYDAGAAGRLIAQMLEIRDHWLPLIGAGAGVHAARPLLERTLGRIANSALHRVRAAVPPDVAQELVEVTRFAAANVEAGHDIAACRGMVNLPGTTAFDIALWTGLAALLRTKEGWRKAFDKRIGIPSTDRRMKDRVGRLASVLKDNVEFGQALDQLACTPAPCFEPGQWEILEALFTLLPLTVGHLRVAFSETGVVDFIEIAQAARAALGMADHPTDLGLAMGCRIEHLLVDEFQDTSRSQYELLKSLTAGWEDGDGRTLFLVGDPMQSIYRFRQTDVGLYLSIRERGLARLQPEPLTLGVNFRSAPALVDWVNATFANAFPAIQDAALGGVPYSASVPFRGVDSEARVSVHPLFGRDDVREARKMVRVIESELDAGANVAVLVRARSHLLETAQMLRRAKIPFRAIEIDLLGARPVVQDLLALTRALLHPGDRTAWLAILRAPWCGLALADLQALAGEGDRTILWDRICGEECSLSDDAKPRVSRFRAVMSGVLERRGRMALRTLVEGAWLALNGPACLSEETDRVDADAYLSLLEREERGGDLEDVDAFAAKVNELYSAPDPHAPESLELMTVHKAKGLEFDTVIVAGLGRKPKTDENRLLLWSEHESEVVLAPMPRRHGDTDRLYSFLQAEEKARADYETVRLLYVACTRARRRLHLIGHTAVREVDGTRVFVEPDSASFLRVIWHAVRNDFESAWSGSQSEMPPQEIGRTLLLRRLPAGSFAGDVPSIGGGAGSGALPARHRAGTAERIGSMVHVILERIAHTGINNWDALRVRNLRAAIAAGLAMAGVPSIELEPALHAVEAALQRTIADERGRWALSPHFEAKCEFALGAVIDGNVRRFRIDRTFVDEDGVRWIIDFKTSRPGDDERAGYREQVQTYARLFREIEQRPVRAGLYYPLTGEWEES